MYEAVARVYFQRQLYLMFPKLTVLIFWIYLIGEEWEFLELNIFILLFMSNNENTKLWELVTSHLTYLIAEHDLKLL